MVGRRAQPPQCPQQGGDQDLPFSRHWEPLAPFLWIKPVPGTSTITFGSKSNIPDVEIYLGTLQANVKCSFGITWMSLG